MEVDFVNSTFSLKLGDAEIDESHVRIDGLDSVIRPDKHTEAYSRLSFTPCAQNTAPKWALPPTERSRTVCHLARFRPAPVGADAWLSGWPLRGPWTPRIPPRSGPELILGEPAAVQPWRPTRTKSPVGRDRGSCWPGSVDEAADYPTIKLVSKPLAGDCCRMDSGAVLLIPQAILFDLTFRVHDCKRVCKTRTCFLMMNQCLNDPPCRETTFFPRISPEKLLFYFKDCSEWNPL